MDKVGRQTFIQSLNRTMGQEVKVESDFFDYPFYLRYLQEPMRTTIRFNVELDGLPFSEENAKEALVSSYENILSEIDKIHLQENIIVTADDIRQELIKKGASTIEDLLVGFGFKKYEVYENGKKICGITLNNPGNIRHIGDRGVL